MKQRARQEVGGRSPHRALLKWPARPILPKRLDLICFRVSIFVRRAAASTRLTRLEEKTKGGAANAGVTRRQHLPPATLDLASISY